MGLGRALGGDHGVTFVIGNAHRISASLFAPATPLPPPWPMNSVKPPNRSTSVLWCPWGWLLYLITYLVQVVAQMMLRRMYRAWSVGFMKLRPAHRTPPHRPGGEHLGGASALLGILILFWILYVVLARGLGAIIWRSSPSCPPRPGWGAGAGQCHRRDLVPPRWPRSLPFPRG